jgi:four helix bundle protein
MHRYEDLEVWQLAYELTRQMYVDTRGFPAEERYGLTSQLRRAATSVISNIAEGAGRRTNGEFRNHGSIAAGSSFEVDCQLQLAGDLGYMDRLLVEKRLEGWRRVQKMLYRLDESLSNDPPIR